MPILEVLGFSGNMEEGQILIRDLKQAVASVMELGVTVKRVTPFLIPAQQEIAGEVMVVKVIGLFDKPERTAEVRKMLVRKIYGTVWLFLQKCGMSMTEFVEVINGDRINPDQGDYYSADPRIWTPDELFGK